MNPKLSIAYFVTPHGFGHAARACAVMNAISCRWPFVRFEIFTQTPEWFFRQSLNMEFVYHPELSDIGLVQTSALHFDLEKTLAALDQFFPLDTVRLAELGDILSQADCHLVISDISPLGIEVAQYAGISSVLIENFTWDWIYEPYASHDFRFKKYIDILGHIFTRADHRIQADPVCDPGSGHVCTPPISRIPVSDSRAVREKLGIRPNGKMVLISMGGIAEPLVFTRQLEKYPDIRFVIPQIGNCSADDPEKPENVISLSANSSFYHPDLVNAADAVIGKVGYSTLAEVYHAGVPYGFVTRHDFRESPVFESYIRKYMAGVQIAEKEFVSGTWLKQLPELLALPKRTKKEPNGAAVAAEYICTCLAREKEILEVVDKQGSIIGAAPRKCVHGNNSLLHRVVHVLVFDSRNRLLLQKRSLNKRVAPGRWDTSVGGHVDCGESIETAMAREMAEELGISPHRLEYVYQYIHANDFESELVFTYISHHDGEVVFNSEEIDDVRFWEINEIEACLGEKILSDNFEDEFKRYHQWLKNKEYAEIKN